MVMNAKAAWATAYVEFHLNSTYVLMIVNISLYAEWKSTKIYALLPIQRDFIGAADLCKSSKEYLNAETCKLYT